MEFSHASMPTPGSQAHEIVELKGTGHPDSMCDAISAAASALYSAYTLDRYGRVLNHFIDNVTIVGGSSHITWGDARLVSPIRVFFHGGLSDSFAGDSVPIPELLEAAAGRVFAARTPRIPFNESVDLRLELASVSGVHTRDVYWYQPRSVDDLMDPDRATAVDTSAVTSFWPFTETENLVSAVDSRVRSGTFLRRMGPIGTDTKVLAVRRGFTIDVTVHIPVLAGQVSSLDDYSDMVRTMKSHLQELASQASPNCSVNLRVNPGNTYTAVYSGALELRDVGSTGRGNFYNGIISTYRPHSMECPFGKAPSNYAGVMLAEAGIEAARSLYQAFNKYFQITFASRLGDPVTRPSNVLIEADAPYDRIRAEEIVAGVLSDPRGISQRIIDRFMP